MKFGFTESPDESDYESTSSPELIPLYPENPDHWSDPFEGEDD